MTTTTHPARRLLPVLLALPLALVGALPAVPSHADDGAALATATVAGSHHRWRTASAPR
ncbi:hypothetical protein L615_001200000250 [Nocardioides sp. J9]|uniref:hypothetical protein n=1 Tax=unclassified Nocardioides TaxID=2615069 RepID=UPI0004BBFCD0|nr:MULTISPECIES: hypothetical protein [unclassified Nocardioides]TWH03156.1 hypothetical protein L615_001200000250 [Nocardioides sp. J9]